MDEQISDIKWVKETKLVATAISGKPPRRGLFFTVWSCFLIVLVSQIFWGDLYGAQSLLPAISNKIFGEGELWRVFTATLIHGDFAHLLSNLSLLFVFGVLLSGYFGPRLFPVYCFLLAGLVNLISSYTYGPGIRLLGASGMVYLMGGIWLTLYFLVQRQHNLKNRIYRSIGFSLMVFFPSSFDPTTSYRTHAIGFFVGVGFALVYFYRNKERFRALEVYETRLVQEEEIYH
ncbi:MAG: rhomboid family intramembrane serine protease [Bdellovibrionales bacterium]